MRMNKLYKLAYQCDQFGGWNCVYSNNTYTIYNKDMTRCVKGTYAICRNYFTMLIRLREINKLQPNYSN